MLYYDKEISVNCISKLTTSLLPGGIIAIGAKEQMPDSFESGLNCLNTKEKTYRKHGFEIIWKNEQ
jgi:chemotaxis methyl-accepting protein methylase